MIPLFISICVVMPPCQGQRHGGTRVAQSRVMPPSTPATHHGTYTRVKECVAGVARRPLTPRPRVGILACACGLCVRDLLHASTNGRS